jgi:hypothetical protein
LLINGCNRVKKMHQPLGFVAGKRVHRAIRTTHAEEPMMTTTIPATQNESWGFWGTLEPHAADAWPLAMTKIAEATGEDLETVRAFLDSRQGRHFGDSVQEQLYWGKDMDAALDAAVAKWMGWTIGRQTSKDYGIPKGLPYLTGFVVHAGILAEDEVV